MTAAVDLAPLERRLVAAVEVGEVVDLRGTGPAPVDAAEMDGWGAERAVRAEVVRDILLGRVGSGADPRGLRLCGARVVGTLDLEGVRIEMLLRLTECDFTDMVWVHGSQLQLLDLRGSRLRGLNGRELAVQRALLLGRVVAGHIGLVRHGR